MSLWKQLSLWVQNQVGSRCVEVGFPGRGGESPVPRGMQTQTAKRVLSSSGRLSLHGLAVSGPGSPTVGRGVRRCVPFTPWGSRFGSFHCGYHTTQSVNEASHTPRHTQTHSAQLSPTEGNCLCKNPQSQQNSPAPYTINQI